MASLLAVVGCVAFFMVQTPTVDAQETTEQNEEERPAVVFIATTEESLIAPTAEVPGTTVSISDSLIAAATAGQVTWVADVGTQLEEGDVIARLDPSDALLNLDDARADVGRLEARADYLQKLGARYDGLGEDSGESEAAMDAVRADYGEAEGALKRGRVAAKRAALALERTEIRAPFSGNVASREVEIGEFAGVGTPIARFVDTDRLEVSARASATVLSSVETNDDVAIRYGDQTITGTVRAVVPVGDDTTRTLEVRIGMASQVDWPIGAPVRVHLPATAPRQAVAAPRDSIILRNDGAAIFKVTEDNSAIRIPVELGAGDGDLIEIMGDVAAGERVVVRGGERLRDGQKVEVRSPQPAS
ncbi:MAG: efflux RND transporter periplasmic adaptor subunit [Pseudomonadota bacterium]